MGSRLKQLFEDHAARLPPVRSILKRRYKNRFDRAAGTLRLFHGIYPDFASALRDVPAGRLEGHDNAPSVLRLADGRLRIYPFDYPVMFWLQKLLPDCRLLFDLGGGVGISYFGYRKYLQCPPAMTWLVGELPAAVAHGEQIAHQEGAESLRFTTSLEELEHADILLASGTVQLIEKPFEMLRSVRRLPPHLLINKAPLYNRPAAVTLHNTGAALCASHLFNRAQFVSECQALGYELVDEWANLGLAAHVPYFPQHAIPAYTGFYFARSRD
ncbi:MAG: methyltransferase, TIGR04325 family [Terriglobales bacterium]